MSPLARQQRERDASGREPAIKSLEGSAQLADVFLGCSACASEILVPKRHQTTNQLVNPVNGQSVSSVVWIQNGFTMATRMEQSVADAQQVVLYLQKLRDTIMEWGVLAMRSSACVQLLSTALGVMSIWMKQSVLVQRGGVGEAQSSVSKTESVKRQTCRLKLVAHAKEETLTETLGGNVEHCLRSIELRGQRLLAPRFLHGHWLVLFVVFVFTRHNM